MNALSQIKPVAQNVCVGKGKITLGKIGEADFRITAGELPGFAAAALDYLCTELSKAANLCAKCADGAVEIALELSDDVPEVMVKNADQGYKIEAEDGKITLTGYGEAGLYYAAVTFMQCLEIANNVISFPKATIIDWPDLKTRGHFMECRYASNLMTLDDWKEVVDNMVSMKMNQLVVALYGCWRVQYDGVVSEYVYIPIPQYPDIKSCVYKRYFSPKKNEWINEIVDVPMAKDDFFGDLIAYGKSRGVEVLPLWNSYGHNSLIPKLYPETAAITEGKPGYNAFCVSSPKTYELLFNIYDYIIDKYLAPNGITSFHIGMDEVRNEWAVDTNDIFHIFSPWCECEECSKLGNDQKFLNHALKLIKHLKERGMKSVYIYCDMFTKIMTPEDFKKVLEENDLLDVTVIDWWTYQAKREKLRFQTVYPELGIRATVKPWNSYYHWNVTLDSSINIYYLLEIAHNDNAEGLQSYSAWDKTCDKNHVCMADYAWNFLGTGSIEEFNDRYAYREFGSRYDEARHAIALMDKVMEELNTNPDADEEDSIGNGRITQNTLSYYFYSYVHQGKCYPRNYPGEAVSILLADREKFEAHLTEISELGNEAIDIFESLAQDTSCNTELARRFACELRNHVAIAEDFLALLDIHDIMEEGERNAVVSGTIAEIAKERKEKRLSLMLEMESFKEDFLIPSHLRNQSIYMQMFADIEAYVNTTAPAELNLDVTDMRDIGSKVYYKLR